MAATASSAASLTQIRAHILITLDMNKMNYDQWQILFETHYQSFSVTGHLDDTALPTGPTDTTWKQLNNTVKMWIYGKISEYLLQSVLKNQCTAHDLWLTLENLSRDNKEARAIQLENELRNLTMGNLSVHTYCQKMKSISNTLANVNSPVSDRALVMHLLNGLSSKIDNIINVIKHRSPPCSFSDARSMLMNEEDRLKTHRRPDVIHADNPSSLQIFLASSIAWRQPRDTYDQRTQHGDQWEHSGSGGRDWRGGRGGRKSQP